MSNLDIIQTNNANLRKCIEKAETLPDASTGSDQTFIQLYNTQVLSNDDITSVPNDLCRNWYFLKGLNLPNVVFAGTYICYGCTNLEEVSMPNCEEIGVYGFYNNTSLKGIDFPKLKSVLGNVFRQCTSATYINLPECTSLAENAFQKDALIEKMDFPKLTSIAATAFDQCSTLVTVILRAGQVCTLANVSAFNNTPIKNGTGYVYVPSTLVDSYKSASNWSTYAAQIRAIEDYPEITGG